MFYSTQILSKKGPLGVIWIAAHLDRRLKRHQIFETSIPVSVDSIINPEAPLALRLSGQLLLGVVRIYSRKVGYLYQDCNDALVRLQQAFKDSVVDLPVDGVTAPLHAITLPDSYTDFDFFPGDDVFPLQPFGQLEALPTLSVNLTKQSLSLTLVEDLSEAFGSQHPLDDEQFEIAGDEMERRISISDGVERLRGEAEPLADHFLGLPAGRPSSPGMEMFKEDELLPPVDKFSGLGAEALGAPPSAPPSSVRQHLMDTPGGSNRTPAHDLDDMLPEVGLPTPAALDMDMEDAVERQRSASPQHLEELAPPPEPMEEAAAEPAAALAEAAAEPGVTEAAEELAAAPEAVEAIQAIEEAEAATAAEVERDVGEAGPSGVMETEVPQHQAAEQEEAAEQPEQSTAVQLKLSRKRKIKLDILDGKPATELPGNQIRALLKDRSPLMCQRGRQLKRGRMDDARGPGIAQPASRMYRAAIADHMAPALMELYNTAMTAAEKPVRERKRKAREEAEGAEPAAGPSAAPLSPGHPDDSDDAQPRDAPPPDAALPEAAATIDCAEDDEPRDKDAAAEAVDDRELHPEGVVDGGVEAATGQEDAEQREELTGAEQLGVAAELEREQFGVAGELEGEQFEVAGGLEEAEQFEVGGGLEGEQFEVAGGEQFEVAGGLDEEQFEVAGGEQFEVAVGLEEEQFEVAGGDQFEVAGGLEEEQFEVAAPMELEAGVSGYEHVNGDGAPEPSGPLDVEAAERAEDEERQLYEEEDFRLEDEDDEYEEHSEVDTQQGFTARTNKVATCLKKQLAAKRNGVKGVKAPADQLHLNGLLKGKSRGESARWFFEMLVLKTKNYVELDQDSPYGNIVITSQSKLTEQL